jgi:two-component system cell cycle sensor histidine kinase/response regulator CckA
MTFSADAGGGTMAPGTPSNSNATERRLQSLLAATSAFLFEIDGDGVIRYVNRTYPGLTADDVVGTSLTSWFPEALQPRIADLLRAAFDSDESQETEYTIPDPEGVPRTWSCEMQPTSDADGAPLVVLTAIEITRRAAAEEALRYSESLFRKVFEVLPVGLWIAGPDGALQRGNPEGVRIWGAEPQVPQEEYGVFTARRLPSGEEIAPDDWALAHTVNDGATITNELIEIDAFDGEQRVVLNSTAPVLDDDGNTVAAIVVNEDITHLYRTEDELRRNRQRLIDAQDLARLGHFEWEVETGKVIWSESLYRIYGFNPEDEIDLSTVNEHIHHPDDLDRITAWLTECIAAGEGHTSRNEYRLLHTDGTVIDAAVAVRVTRDVTHGTRLFGIVHDISDRKRAEAEREQLQRQLVQTQRLESVGRLAGGVAHDFNNMLSIIMGNIDLVGGREDDTERVRQALREIHTAAERSADLTRQLLAFARRQTIAPKVLRINDCVEKTLKMLRRLIGEDIDLLWMPGGGEPTVKMDPAQIDQVLANLVINARDAIADVGKVTIETDVRTFDRAYCEMHPDALEGRYAMLAVSDDGCGMDRATLVHVFEPFFTSKGVGEGTGLGLATVYGIVRQNRGFINVYSEPGHGTTFRIYLPVLEDLDESEDDLSTIRPVAAPDREVVLLVEDDLSMLTMGRHMLEQLGYRVLPSSKPVEALAMAAEHEARIDLLITDVIMPEMNGAELARRVADIHPEAIPVFMSGYTANVIAHHGVLDEGVHFLQKPFSLAQLSVALRDILQSEERSTDDDPPQPGRL